MLKCIIHQIFVPSTAGPIYSSQVAKAGQLFILQDFLKGVFFLVCAQVDGEVILAFVSLS